MVCYRLILASKWPSFIKPLELRPATGIMMAVNRSHIGTILVNWPAKIPLWPAISPANSLIMVLYWPYVGHISASYRPDLSLCPEPGVMKKRAGGGGMELEEYEGTWKDGQES